jgi:hypothetical protein
MFVAYLYTEFHSPSFIISTLLINMKQTNLRLNVAVMLLFGVIQMLPLKLHFKDLLAHTTYFKNNRNLMKELPAVIAEEASLLSIHFRLHNLILQDLSQRYLTYSSSKWTLLVFRFGILNSLIVKINSLTRIDKISSASINKVYE